MGRQERELPAVWIGMSRLGFCVALRATPDESVRGYVLRLGLQAQSSGRTQMLRKLRGGLGSPWACSLMGAPSKAL